MARIRVLIVDDAVVIRRMLTDVLAADEELEVVGTAANGRIALAKLPQVNPDVVIMDVEMPEMNGLETLVALRKLHPRLPVIMFSTLTARGAVTTLDALSLGATDYITKPANVGSVMLAQQRVREDLVPKIKALGGRRGKPELGMGRPAPTRSSSGSLPRPLATGLAVPPDVVAIGVSTGGPNALADILPALPGDLPVPIVIVQHMPPVFTRFLAERLSTKSAIGACEGAPGMVLQPRRAYLAPGDWHMTLERTAGGIVIRTNQETPENSCRPAVDVLFRSCVEVYGPHVLGVVLTGMGQDGLRGARAIQEAGGRVIVQDEATSVVWGMPGFVAQAGLAEQVLPLRNVAAAIVQRVVARAGRSRAAGA